MERCACGVRRGQPPPHFDAQRQTPFVLANKGEQASVWCSSPATRATSVECPVTVGGRDNLSCKLPAHSTTKNLEKNLACFSARLRMLGRTGNLPFFRLTQNNQTEIRTAITQLVYTGGLCP
jgi:hypothetical protein